MGKILTFDEINNRLKDKTTLEIISMDNKKATLHCKKCDAIYELSKKSLRLYRGCSVCCGRKIVVGINDVATTDPDILKYLKNIEDGHKYSRGSIKKIDFKCPICGKIKRMQISNFFYFGFRCEYCSDNVSAPNKFSRSFLSQLPITNLIPEYSPKWISPKRYDNYFEYNGNKYILEMDGGFHYMDNTYNENITLEIVKEADSYKDKLAEEHGIKIIRIDCRSLNFIEIQKKIESSELSRIFDLSMIDWHKCQIDATKNLIIQACELFKNNTKVKDIANIIGVNRQTVRKYLKKGNEIGIIKYNTKIKIADYKIIDVYKEIDGSFVGTCNYYNEVERLLYSLNPNEIYNTCSIKKYTLNHTPYKGYIFIERDNINE